MSEKAKTNKKWTSTEKYRDNHDAIFQKEEAVIEAWKQAETEYVQNPGEVNYLRRVVFERDRFLKQEARRKQ